MKPQALTEAALGGRSYDPPEHLAERRADRKVRPKVSPKMKRAATARHRVTGN